jgi:hypothetical protein
MDFSQTDWESESAVTAREGRRTRSERRGDPNRMLDAGAMRAGEM